MLATGGLVLAYSVLPTVAASRQQSSAHLRQPLCGSGGQHKPIYNNSYVMHRDESAV